MQTGDDYFVPMVMPPPKITTAAPPRQSRIPVIVGAVVVVAIGAYFVLPGSSSHVEAPTVLPARTPTAGLPSSLGDVVRMQAESNRRTALQAVERVASSNSGPTITALAAAQPNFTWIGANQTSTGPTIVSFGNDTASDAGGTVTTIAVSATNHDVCAFGRWSSAGGPEYVTMAHVKTCRAIDAPANGWAAEPGGAASDLPDDSG